MTRSLTMTLRGREVAIEYELVGADRSAGIMSESFEDETITDVETDEQLDWELTDDEILQVNERIAVSLQQEDVD